MSADPRRQVPRTDTLLADPRLTGAGERLGRERHGDRRRLLGGERQRQRDGGAGHGAGHAGDGGGTH